MSPARIRRILQTAMEHHRAGRLGPAELGYREIRATVPDHFDALHLSGLVAYQQQRHDEAFDLLSRALRLEPGSELCALRLALVWLARGDPRRAEALLRQAVSRQPALAEGWEHLGLALKLQDRLKEAIVCQRRVVSLRSADPIGWCNLGLTFASLGDLTEALACHDRALAIDAACVGARFGRAQALQQSHRMREALAEYDRVLVLAPDHLEARSCRLTALQYLDGVSREQLFAEHRAYGQALGPASPPSAGPPSGGERRPLQVAILSPDLRTHACAFFLEPILRHLDRQRFAVTLYHDHFREDAVSQRLRTHAVRWRNFVGQPGVEVERAIRADAPDILIDLAGHANGGGRLPLFARRLAPLQITYLGYPDTTGVPGMDCRLTDSLADPVGEADGLATERLVRFAPTAWAYQPPEDAPEPRPPPSAGGAPFTFGSFNYLGKITDPMLRLWGELLQRVPGSRLLLKGLRLEEAQVRARIGERLVAAGIAPGRVGLLGHTAAMADHLALYHRVDVALDPHPYHGTTTTCEALWMGVPVVSLPGDRHASRVGVSLLTAVGHPEWLAADGPDYVRIAAGLATDPGRLARARAELRSRMAQSALLDHAGQAARFGRALEECWSRVGVV